MFNEIRRIGQYARSRLENEGLSEESVLIEKSKMEGARILSAIFELQNGELTYKHVDLEEYDEQRSDKYLYRTFKHGQYDVTLTTRIYSLENLRRRTLLWFDKYAKIYNEWPIHALNDAVHKESDKIFGEIFNEYKELDRKKWRNIIFTVKIRERDEENLLGDYEIFRKILKEESIRAFFDKYRVESRGIATCYLCREYREVYGFASPFSFYTFDKRGFAPNLIRELAWKRLPICSNCAISLEAGKEVLNKYLLKNFGRFRFYVIPKFPFGDVNEEVMETIRQASSKSYARSILCAEDDILEDLKDEQNLLSLIFMFIDPKQKDFFDVIKYVEDVPPSWIKKIYEALEETESFSLSQEDTLKKILGKTQIGGLKHFTIRGLLQPFFPKGYGKFFIDITGDILAQNLIDRKLLIQAFIREIRKAYVDEERKKEKFLCLKSFILLMLLEKLKLI